MKNIYLRTKHIAQYVVETGATVRQTAKVYKMAKSTVHYDLTKRLPYFDYSLYQQVRKILEKNFEEKSIRGGLSTKNKYIKLKQKY